MLSQKERSDESSAVLQTEQKNTLRQRTKSPSKRMETRSYDLPTLPKEWGQQRDPDSGNSAEAEIRTAHTTQFVQVNTQAPPNSGGCTQTSAHEAETNSRSHQCSDHEPKDGKMAGKSKIQEHEDVEMEDLEEKPAVPRVQVSTMEEVKQSENFEAASLSPNYTSPRRGRSPTKKYIGQTQYSRRFTRKKPMRKGSKESKVGSRPASSPRSKTSVSRGKAAAAAKDAQKRGASYSPKRRAPEEWDEARSGGAEAKLTQGVKAQKREGAARSLSPNKLPNGGFSKGDKTTTQSYMYQFIQVEGEQTTSKRKQDEADVEQKEAGGANMLGAEICTSPKANFSQEEYPQSPNELKESEDFRLTKVNPPTGVGVSLDTWLAIFFFGGEVVEVAATGQCGWLAFYSSLYNITEGLESPTVEVTEEANELKKQVLNGMIANVADESHLHSSELQVEVIACGGQEAKHLPIDDQICVLANHYAAQRLKSVKATVPLEYWVRPAHIKAMAMHARETIYVLDVERSGQATLQAYDYCEARLDGSGYIETGQVTTWPTQLATEMIQELVEGGILPTVMLLRWREGLNHFQAVVYDDKRYKCYTSNLQELAGVRTAIMGKYGVCKLDLEPYDRMKTARTAARELKTIRKAAKISRQARGAKGGQHPEIEVEEDVLDTPTSTVKDLVGAVDGRATMQHEDISVDQGGRKFSRVATTTYMHGTHPPVAQQDRKSDTEPRKKEASRRRCPDTTRGKHGRSTNEKRTRLSGDMAGN